MSVNIFRHLLPKSRGFNLKANKTIYDFFNALTVIPDDYKAHIDQVFLDWFPYTTREIDLWEKQFGLATTNTNETFRRARLDATWKALGGQSPRYIQDTLQNAGFDVYVHEWWDPLDLAPCPTPRDPNLYIKDGTTPTVYQMLDNQDTAQDNDPEAMDGFGIGPQGYLLVNKTEILAASQFEFVDGGQCAQDGEEIAQDGDLGNFYEQQQFEIPSDPLLWQSFAYIGGPTFPEIATVDTNRREEFETLVLKVCPNQLWLGMLITYS